MDEPSPAPAAAEVVDAAWELQVDLSTRIGTGPALPTGVLAEALDALQAVLGQARRTAAAPGAGRGAERLRSAAAELEAVLQPAVDRWRPEWDAHEETRPGGVPLADHEAAWPQAEQMRAELDALTGPLRRVTAALGAITGADLELDRT